MSHSDKPWPNIDVPPEIADQLELLTPDDLLAFAEAVRARGTHARLNALRGMSDRGVQIAARVVGDLLDHFGR